MTITYNVEVPEKKCGSRKAGEFLIAVKKFLESNEQTMCAEFEDVKTSSTKYNSLHIYQRRNKHTHYSVMRRKNKICIIQN